MNAYAHQELPFEHLIQALETEHGFERASLCRILFILQNATPQPPAFKTMTIRFQEGLEQLGEPEMAATTFDMVLILRDHPERLTGLCVYKTCLFKAETINRMLDYFQHILACLASKPATALSAFNALKDV